MANERIFWVCSTINKHFCESSGNHNASVCHRDF